MISKYFEFVNNKSNKFWKIEYSPDSMDNSDKIEYITTYGSRNHGKKASSTTKKGTLEEIEKLIMSKVKKGYVEVAEEFNVSVTKEIIKRKSKKKNKNKRVKSKKR